MVCKPVLVLLGKFDAKDLVFYFERLGIRLDLTDAEKLVQKYAKEPLEGETHLSRIQNGPGRFAGDLLRRVAILLPEQSTRSRSSDNRPT